MLQTFYKYQATANDFIILNQFDKSEPTSYPQELVERWCHRRWGVGADGLMIIAPSELGDFKMVYYNSDGRLSTMCGNGGRAIVHLAYRLGIIGQKTTFEAVDGLHEARIEGDRVELKMIDINSVQSLDDAYTLDTGSPHFVRFVSDLDTFPLVEQARAIRYGDLFQREGINVNFAEIGEHCLKARTYERGVEDETYSCGTGVTAVAIAFGVEENLPDGHHTILISTKGGALEVSYRRDGNRFDNVWLQGPAQLVFEGILSMAE